MHHLWSSWLMPFVLIQTMSTSFSSNNFCVYRRHRAPLRRYNTAYYGHSVTHDRIATRGWLYRQRRRRHTTELSIKDKSPNTIRQINCLLSPGYHLDIPFVLPMILLNSLDYNSIIWESHIRVRNGTEIILWYWLWSLTAITHGSSLEGRCHATEPIVHVAALLSIHKHSYIQLILLLQSMKMKKCTCIIA